MFMSNALLICSNYLAYLTTVVLMNSSRADIHSYLNKAPCRHPIACR